MTFNDTDSNITWHTLFIPRGTATWHSCHTLSGISAQHRVPLYTHGQCYSSICPHAHMLNSMSIQVTHCTKYSSISCIILAQMVWQAFLQTENMKYVCTCVSVCVWHVCACMSVKYNLKVTGEHCLVCFPINMKSDHWKYNKKFWRESNCQESVWGDWVHLFMREALVILFITVLHLWLGRPCLEPDFNVHYLKAPHRCSCPWNDIHTGDTLYWK